MCASGVHLPKKKRKQCNNGKTVEKLPTTDVTLYEYMDRIYVARESINLMFGDDLCSTFEKSANTYKALAYSTDKLTEFIKCVSLNTEETHRTIKGLVTIYHAMLKASGTNGTKLSYKTAAIELMRTISDHLD